MKFLLGNEKFSNLRIYISFVHKGNAYLTTHSTHFHGYVALDLCLNSECYVIVFYIDKLL